MLSLSGILIFSMSFFVCFYSAEEDHHLKKVKPSSPPRELIGMGNEESHLVGISDVSTTSQSTIAATDSGHSNTTTDIQATSESKSSASTEATTHVVEPMSAPNPQQEEGWRWKNSLNFSYRDFHSTEHFNVDAFHDEMAALELGITEVFPANKRGNIVIGAISILVKKTSGEWYLAGDYIRDIESTKPIIFVSGYLNKAQKEDIARSPYGEHYAFVDQNNFGSEKDLKTELAHLLGNLPGKKGVIDAFKHAEQLLHLHLSKIGKETIADILSRSRIDHNDEIHTIILHIHSRLDICTHCAQSLSWMSRDDRKLVEELKKAIVRSYKVPDSTQENGGIKFLLLASSREVYTDQCGRRWNNGHDGRYNSVINAETFAPYFAAKPINPFLLPRFANLNEVH